MPGKRIVVYVDDKIQKALKHKCVEQGLSISNIVLKLIKQYLHSGNNDQLAQNLCVKVPTAAKSVASIKERARASDTAVLRHTRPRKGPVIEPIERPIRV